MRPVFGLLVIALAGCGSGLDQPGAAAGLSDEQTTPGGVLGMPRVSTPLPATSTSPAAPFAGAIMAEFSQAAANRATCPFPLSLLPGGLTHVAYTYAPVTSSGVTGDGNWSSFNAIKQGQPVKTLLALGGPTQNTNVTWQSSTATQIISQARSANFDGVELVWPQNSNTVPTVGPMVELLRTAIGADAQAHHGSALILAVSIGADQASLGQYGLAALQRITDLLIVRGYDNHGPWQPNLDSEAAYGADYDSANPGDVQQAIATCLSAGFDAGQLVVAVAPYGRSWGNISPGMTFGSAATTPGPAEACSATPGLMSYGEITAHLTGGGDFTRMWDAPTSTPYLFSPSQGIWASFEDEESLLFKVNFVRQSGLGGLLIHAPDLDNTAAGSPLVGFILQQL